MNSPRGDVNSAPGAAGTLRPGLRLAGARYSLKRMLGRGGFSEVWLAFDRAREQELALKFLPRSLLRDPQFVEVLREQTRRTAELDHPAIVKVYEVMQDPEHLALSMEYIDGWSLAALKVDRPHKRYGSEEVLPWAQSLCSALEHAHEHSIFHRDLKPTNLLLNAREQLKVTDFGLAQTVRTALAQQGQYVYGSVAYLSPQQIKGAAACAADDIYSLGATLFDLLTGTPPFHTGEILAQVFELAPPTMTERLAQLGVDASVPKAWEQAVASCLAKEPRARPQSLGEVLQLLQPKTEVEPEEGSSEPKSAEDSSATALPGETIQETAPQQTESVPAAEPLSLAEGQADTPEAQPATAIAEVPDAEPEPALEVDAPGSARRRWAVLAAGVVACVVLGLAAWWLPHLGGTVKHLGRLATSSGPAAALDPDFKAGTGADSEIRSLAAEPDGHIYTGGKFSFFDDIALSGIVRLNPDGTLDPGFTPQAQGAVHAIAVQSDGKLVLGGDFTSLCGESRKHIARVSSSGMLDYSFSSTASFNREVRALQVQPDGKLVVAGGFDSFAGKKFNRLVRLNADGTLDSSFIVTGGANRLVWALAGQPDGKLLVCGDFTTFNYEPRGRFVRLNRDGTVDTTFKSDPGADAPVLAACVQKDGKILLAGSFLMVHSTSRARVARLMPDGTLDSTFVTGEGPNAAVRCVAVQNDGKVLIAGSFSTVNGQPRGGVARLEPNGALDRSFDPGTGVGSGDVWAALLQKDGGILIGGAFTNWDSSVCGNIARLRGDRQEP